MPDGLPASLTLAAILAGERAIWGDMHMTLPHVAVAACAVAGDLATLARDELEGHPADREDLARELGNLITSAIRWADDLGLSAGECLGAAFTAQRRYVADHGTAENTP